jgi:hypothetical protein
MSNTSTPAQYDGWFTNLFTKEGRAENKENRAERLREKSKGKSSASKAKLQQRADENDMRAAELTRTDVEKEALGPTNADALWGVGFPWLRRPEGIALESQSTKIMAQADGVRPSRSLINLEHRATVVAGLTMLRRAHNPEENKPGYGPFRAIDVDQVPVLPDRATQDKRLIGAVAKAARSRGDDIPKTLREAAEYIRDIVEEEHIGKAAWAMRAMLMTRAAREIYKDEAKKKARAASVLARVAALAVGLPPKATAKVAKAGMKLALRSGQKTIQSYERMYAEIVDQSLTNRRLQDEVADAKEMAKTAQEEAALARHVDVMEEELEDELDAAEESRNTRRNLLIFGSVLAALGMVATAHHYVKVRVTSA